MIFRTVPDTAGKAGWSVASENVASGYNYRSVVAAWMNSPGHRANILNQNLSHDQVASNGVNGLWKYSPILLATPGTGLTDNTLKEIKRLKPTKIIILGGTDSVSSKVESQLKNLP